MPQTVNFSTFDRILNIHQSVKLAQVVNLNKELLNAQLRQNQKLNSLDSKLAEANSLSRQMLQNQIAELKRHEEQIFYKSLAFNCFEIIEKLETIEDINLKTYFVLTYSEKLKANLEKAKETLEELSDKSQIKIYIGRLSTLSNCIINSSEFINSQLSYLNDTISDYQKIEEQFDIELKQLKTTINTVKIPSAGLFGFNNKARLNALNQRSELEKIYTEKVNLKQTALNTHKSKILYNEIAVAYPEFELLLDDINNIENKFKDKFDIKTKIYRDPLIKQAAQIIVTHQQGSSSLLQRRLKLGYKRAEKIIDQLEEDGIIAASDGTNNRKVIVQNLADLDKFFAQ
jgi:hypothetical protein